MRLRFENVFKIRARRGGNPRDKRPTKRETDMLTPSERIATTSGILASGEDGVIAVPCPPRCYISRMVIVQVDARRSASPRKSTLGPSGARNRYRVRQRLNDSRRRLQDDVRPGRGGRLRDVLHRVEDTTVSGRRPPLGDDRAVKDVVREHNGCAIAQRLAEVRVRPGRRRYDDPDRGPPAGPSVVRRDRSVGRHIGGRDRVVLGPLLRRR